MIEGRAAIAKALAGRAAVERDRAAAFNSLVGAALDNVYRRAAVLLNDRFEAEDAVHDAVVRAWRSWGSLRDPARFDAWFGRILVNTCRDRLRARRRVGRIQVPHAGTEADMPASVDRLGAVDDSELIRDALARLGADDRIVVVLRYEADLTVPAIAALVGIAEGTVKSRLHHALRKLRASVEERGS